MFQELATLLDFVPSGEATVAEYRNAIVDQNCLGKRSEKTRILTSRHMAELYGLDTRLPLFRGLHFLWSRDVKSQSILALLCAMARDTMLRNSAEIILSLHAKDVLPRSQMEQWIDSQEPSRFSPATLKSAAQNLNSSWTKTGHLIGKAQKVRSIAEPGAGAAMYALYLGYLDGGRGENLLHTTYAKVLDCPASKVLELAELAALRGWFRLKRVGSVIEVAFPNLLRTEELEWLYE